MGKGHSIIIEDNCVQSRLLNLSIILMIKRVSNECHLACVAIVLWFSIICDLILNKNRSRGRAEHDPAIY